MRIAHITNSLQLNGTGHTNSTIDLALAQAASGDDVTLVCATTDEDTRELVERHGIVLVDGIGGASISSVFRSRQAIAQVLSDQEVLHMHTVRSLGVAAMLGPVRAWRRSVATIHNPHQRSSVLMYASRRLVTLSGSHQNHVIRQTLHVRHPTVILNGTAGTVRLIPVTKLLRVPLRPHSVLFVGALHRRKGLDVLLRAMRTVVDSVPDAHLYVVGNRDAPQFERMALELGIESHTTFEGFVRDPRTYMLSAQILVLPSRKEGFGNVLTEARECALPIIASNVGGIPQALSGGRAGMLVEVDNEKQLAEAIVAVLTNKAIAAKLRAATADGLEHMTPARACVEYRAVYAELIR